jgi:hypothetical protein
MTNINNIMFNIKKCCKSVCDMFTNVISEIDNTFNSSEPPKNINENNTNQINYDDYDIIN